MSTYVREPRPQVTKDLHEIIVEMTVTVTEDSGLSPAQIRAKLQTCTANKEGGMRPIDDQTENLTLSIEGLAFKRNPVRDLRRIPGWFSTKLLGSDGPLVSDFVTHEPSFTYSTYGIHVGQDDRLTFMGGNGKRISGKFVDCRRGSPTLHKAVEVSFSPSLHRHLVIPRGVAHTFDNLEYVVTRDEPIWYVSDGNEDWDLDNDLISVRRDQATERFPVVNVNEYLLPDAGHLFQSRLSQSLLDTPKAYLGRYSLIIGGKRQYVRFKFKTWGSAEEKEVGELLNVPDYQGSN